MSTFSWVYKPYTFEGGEGSENQIFFCTLYFLAWFLFFSSGFLTQTNVDVYLKNVDVYSFWGGGGVSESMVCTLMKLDIYGRPLTFILLESCQNTSLQKHVRYSWIGSGTLSELWGIHIDRCIMSIPIKSGGGGVRGKGFYYNIITSLP